LKATVLLPALLAAAAAAAAAEATFTLERGGVRIPLPVVVRDGETLVPLGAEARGALEGLGRVTLRVPFVTISSEGLDLRAACGLTRASLGDGRTAFLPDPPRIEDGVPALSPRSLAAALSLLGLKCSWGEPGTRLVLDAPPPPRPEAMAAAGKASGVPLASPAPKVPAAPARTAPAHIVLDAGHGGEDCGARGTHGLCEKEITLDLARRLRRLLEGRGIRVTMTRDDDRKLALPQRVEIAAEANADMFVSLHVNSSPSSAARGVESYVYGANVTSRDVAELVRRENAETNYVDIIVNDLQQRLHHDASIRVAGSVEDELVRKLRVHGRSGMRVKEAPFYVLARARRPAVLLEIGFISNPTEEKKLRDQAWRQRVAESIAGGVARAVGGEMP